VVLATHIIFNSNIISRTEMTSNQVRRFGTDVSNISNGVNNKTPKKIYDNAKNTTPKKTNFEEKVLKSTPAKISSVDIFLDDEIVVKSPTKSYASFYKYERDFLLAFQQFCSEPIEGLISEVLPGFSHPVNEEANSNSRSPMTTPKRKFDKDNQSEQTISPMGGVVFKPFKPRETTPKSTPTKVESTFKSPFKTELPPINFDLEKVPSNGSPLRISSAMEPISPTTIALEWRIKKLKKSKAKETEPKRLAARQKQIDIGLNTPGYKRFCELVPIECRKKEHPKIPDINQVCSKRSWDGQVRKWRRQLHDYDPPLAAGQKRLDDDDVGECDDDAADDAVCSVSEEEDSSEEEAEEQREVQVVSN